MFHGTTFSDVEKTIATHNEHEHAHSHAHSQINDKTCTRPDLITRLEARLQPNIGFTLRRVLAKAENKRK